MCVTLAWCTPGGEGGQRAPPADPLRRPNSSQWAPLTKYCANLFQEEIEKYRGENTSAESQRQQALAELQGRLAETEEQAAWYTHKHEAAVKRVDQLKVGPLCPCMHCVACSMAPPSRIWV